MNKPASGEIRTLPCKHCGTKLEHVWADFAAPRWVALGAHAIVDCIRVLQHRAETAEMMLFNEVDIHKRYMNEVNRKLEDLSCRLAM